MYNWSAAEFEDTDLAKKYQFELCNTTEHTFWYFSCTNATKVVVGFEENSNDSYTKMILSREDAAPTSEDFDVMFEFLTYFVFSGDQSVSESEIAKLKECFDSRKFPVFIGKYRISPSNERHEGYECVKRLVDE
ncbi:hypothetical protein KA183_16090 [bacterium]|nr:hypothetical protein [bacterium]